MNFDHLSTRQLPMGAGHCPWGGYADQIICNIVSIGPLAAAGEVVTDGRWKESQTNIMDL